MPGSRSHFLLSRSYTHSSQNARHTLVLVVSGQYERALLHIRLREDKKAQYCI